MICSKEGNFTSLQVLMIFLILCVQHLVIGSVFLKLVHQPESRKIMQDMKQQLNSSSWKWFIFSLNFYCCLFKGISLCFTLSSNQIKSERSHSLSRIGWSRPWLRLWGFEPLNYLTNDFLNPVKMKRHYLRLNLTAPTERSALNFTLRLSKTPKKYCR